MTEKTQAPKVPKGDPNKQYDVTIGVVHDDRQGKSRSVEKPARYSFATEEEALEFANKIKEIA